MAVKPAIVGPICTNCYVVFDDATKDGIIIDPGDECGKILKLIEKYEVSVSRILLTHGHFDHIGAAAELKEALGSPVHLNKKDWVLAKDPVMNGSMLFSGKNVSLVPDSGLEEGEIVRAGSLEFLVLSTPGHTKGGVSLACVDKIFTGDTLFCDGLGRTDLPGGSHAEILASIKEKLLKYPDKTEIYPGHGYISTIGKEKENY